MMVVLELQYLWEENVLQYLLELVVMAIVDGCSGGGEMKSGLAIQLHKRIEYTYSTDCM